LKENSLGSLGSIQTFSMMGASKPFSLLLVMIASFQVLVSAHTQIWYPPWRNNSFNTPFSQQIYPCM
jgi:hypothetical protein